MKNLKVKRFLALALLAVSLFAVAVPAMAGGGLAPGTGYEAHNNGNGGSINVRNSASTGTNICGTVNTGTALRINYQTGDYYNVDILGNVNSGWVGSKIGKYINVTFVRQTGSGGAGSVHGSGLGAGELAYIDATYVNVRSGAGTNYSVIMTTSGTTWLPVLVVDVSAPVSNYIWYRVQFLGQPYADTVGWVRGDFFAGTT